MESIITEGGGGARKGRKLRKHSPTKAKLQPTIAFDAAFKPYGSHHKPRHNGQLNELQKNGDGGGGVRAQVDLLNGHNCKQHDAIDAKKDIVRPFPPSLKP